MFLEIFIGLKYADWRNIDLAIKFVCLNFLNSHQFWLMD